jgi:hypothetical protein
VPSLSGHAAIPSGVFERSHFDCRSDVLTYIGLTHSLRENKTLRLLVCDTLREPCVAMTEISSPCVSPATLPLIGVAELRYEIQKAHNSNSYSLLRVRLEVKEIHT